MAALGHRIYQFDRMKPRASLKRDESKLVCDYVQKLLENNNNDDNNKNEGVKFYHFGHAVTAVLPT